MKQDFTVSMPDLTDKYGAPLMLIDTETGERISCKEVAKRVQTFYSNHESDRKGKKMQEELKDKLSKVADNEVKVLTASVENFNSITGNTIEDMKYTTIVAFIKAEAKKRGI